MSINSVKETAWNGTECDSELYLPELSQTGDVAFSALDG